MSSSGASSGGRKSSRGGNSSGGRGRGRGGRRGGRGRSNSNNRRSNNSSNSSNNRGSASNGDSRGSKIETTKLPELKDEVSLQPIILTVIVYRCILDYTRRLMRIQAHRFEHTWNTVFSQYFSPLDYHCLLVLYTSLSFVHRMS